MHHATTSYHVLTSWVIPISYGVQLIELHDIEKQNGHPSISGMKAICDQLLEAIK